MAIYLILLLFLLCKAFLDHWELALYKYCILLLLLLLLFYGAGIFLKTGFLCFSFSSLDHTPTAHYLKQMSDTTILDLTSWI